MIKLFLTVRRLILRQSCSMVTKLQPTLRLSLIPARRCLCCIYTWRNWWEFIILLSSKERVNTTRFNFALILIFNWSPNVPVTQNGNYCGYVNILIINFKTVNKNIIVNIIKILLIWSLFWLVIGIFTKFLPNSKFLNDILRTYKKLK